MAFGKSSGQMTSDGSMEPMLYGGQPQTGVTLWGAGSYLKSSRLGLHGRLFPPPPPFFCWLENAHDMPHTLASLLSSDPNVSLGPVWNHRTCS